MIAIERVGDGPIVHAGLSPEIGTNINGPSLLRAPEWSGLPARYALWFAHHLGTSIRLAVADRVEGPWRIHDPSALDLASTPFPTERPDVDQPGWAASIGVDGLYPHIASPDVHVDPEARRFTMWFHGLCPDGEQHSAVAVSSDGLRWEAAPALVGETSYLRIFRHGRRRYALGRGGEVLAERGDGSFEGGHWPFDRAHRHSGVLVRGDVLHVFWTRIGDAPEAILHSTIRLAGDWRGWTVEGTREVMRPERDWEGAGLPVRPTPVGAAMMPENGLRDPYLFEDAGTVWMVYAGAGEDALGLARVMGL